MVRRASSCRARSCCAALLLGGALLATPDPVQAAERILPEASLTLEYADPAPRRYFRAALEELALFGAGLGYYFVEQRTNSIDWALNYDWLSFRRKLTCEACAFDQNFFDTNFATHPAAGMLYYLAARGNRLNLLESVGYAFAMSTLWEFLGEFRERVSVNDAFVTPVSGLVLGESTTQLGALFDRGCPTPANRFLGAAFGPSRTLHDAIDEVRPLRDIECDERGLPRGGAHRIVVSAGTAWVTGRGGPAAEARFAVHSSISHLDSMGKSGRGWLAFSDGNVSSLDARLDLRPPVVSELRLGARVVPAGLYYRSLERDAAARLVGHEVMVGALVGMEYALHRRVYPSESLDRIFLIEAPAAALEGVVRGSSFALHASIDAGATLAGVSAFALGEYRASGSQANLASVTRLQGYSHALGLALEPRIRLVLDAVELGVGGRSDRLFAVRVLDPLREAHGMTPIVETRRRGELWLSFGPVEEVPRATLLFEGYERSGVAGDETRTQSELAAGIRMDAVF